MEGGIERLRQQGRFGYEHYAAAGLASWNISAPDAANYDDITQTEIHGLLVPHDRRPMSFLTSEPFMLAALELGSISPDFSRLSEPIYAVQRRRFEELNIASSAGEDAIPFPPWFVYNTIVYQGEPWTSVSPDGQLQPDLAGFSVKTAFAWAALHDEAFTAELLAFAETLTHERFGFLAGRFDKGELNRTLSLNTNAVVLEAILFTHRGRKPFLRMDEGTAAPLP